MEVSLMWRVTRTVVRADSRGTEGRGRIEMGIGRLARRVLGSGRRGCKRCGCFPAAGTGSWEDRGSLWLWPAQIPGLSHSSAAATPPPFSHPRHPATQGGRLAPTQKPQRPWIPPAMQSSRCSWAAAPPISAPTPLSGSEDGSSSGPRMGTRSVFLRSPAGYLPGAGCILIINFCLSSGHRCGISCSSLFTLPRKATGSSPAVSLRYLSWPRG